MELITSKSRKSVAGRFLVAIVILIACLGSVEARASIEEQRALFHDASLALQKNQILKFKRLMLELEEDPSNP